jgi:hypothetical protein
LKNWVAGGVISEVNDYTNRVPILLSTLENANSYSQIKEDDYSMSMIPRISPLPMDYSDYFCHETLSEAGNSEENVGDYCQITSAARPEYECSLNSPLTGSKGVLNSASGTGGAGGASPDFSRYRSHLSQICSSKRHSITKCTPIFSGLPPALLKRLKNVKKGSFVSLAKEGKDQMEILKFSRADELNFSLKNCVLACSQQKNKTTLKTIQKTKNHNS